MAGFADKDPRNGPFSTGKRPFRLSNTLKLLSSFGMRYDDMVDGKTEGVTDGGNETAEQEVLL